MGSLKRIGMSVSWIGILFLGMQLLPVVGETNSLLQIAEGVSVSVNFGSDSKSFTIPKNSLDATVTCNWSISRDSGWGSGCFKISDSNGTVIVNKNYSAACSGSFQGTRGQTYTVSISRSGGYGGSGAPPRDNGNVTYNWRMYGISYQRTFTGIYSTYNVRLPESGSRAYPIEVWYRFTKGGTNNINQSLTITSSVEKKKLVNVSNNSSSGSFILPANNYMDISVNTGMFSAGGSVMPSSCSLEIRYCFDNVPPNTPTLNQYWDFPGSPYLKKINGTYYCRANPTIIHWNNPGDPGSPSSGVTKFEIYDGYERSNHANYPSTMNVNPNLSSYSYSITDEGAHTIRVRAVDYEGNSSPLSAPVIVVVDYSVSQPVLPANPIQVAVNSRNQYNITFNWNTVTDLSGVNKYQVALSQSATAPSSTEIIDATVNQYTFSNVTYSPNAYYAYVRTVDGAGNTSGWRKSTDIVLPSQSCAISTIKPYSELRNNQPYYEVALTLEEVGAASYVIERQLEGESTRQTVVEMTKAQLAASGFKYTDCFNLIKHGKYTYYVYTKNSLNQKSSENSAQIIIPNIKPTPNISGPRPIVVYTDVKFTLGIKQDREGDLLEYRLYSRASSAGVRTLAKSWAPGSDNQEVTVAFPDKSNLEWEMCCIETNSGIADRSEVVVTDWSPLYIDTRYPLPLCCNDFGENSWGTKGQPLKFKVETNPIAGFTSFKWDFGDGTATASGMQPIHSFTNLGEYTVKVTATDNNGAQYIGKTQIKIVNTPQGRLYADETWTGIYPVDGDINVPAGITLVIEPGTCIKVQSESHLKINGSLKAVDTAKGISFISQSGIWKGIQFDGGGVGLLNGVTISNAERGVACIGSGTVNLQNCIFNGNQAGLHGYSGVINVTSCTFAGNTIYGIKEDNGCNPVVISCIFQNNCISYYDSELLLISVEELNQAPNSGNVFQ